MKGYLLDTNLLIALFWPAHAKHETAIKWFARHRSKGWATCPFTQAGFVRIVSNPAFSRDAVHPREAIQVLAANLRADDHVFWADNLAVPAAVSFAEARLVGHRQITDAYLLGLALSRDGALATLDRGIESLTASNSAARSACEIIS